MLREWNGNSNDLIVDALKKFAIETKEISLLKYESLTPDSFIWYLSIMEEGKSRHYCIYAEDFIPSLEHVATTMNGNLPVWSFEDAYELVPVKKRQKWEEATPVKMADTYPSPKETAELMKYASTSGFDFVFLGNSVHNN